MYNCSKCGRSVDVPEDVSVREAYCECGNLVTFPVIPVPLFASESSEGIVVSGYRIIRKIGAGGMGSVFEAVQESLGRMVAIKILSDRLASDPQFIKRFEREAGALSQLRHPNIGGIIDRGSVNGIYYFVMEYVADKNGNIITLDDLIVQHQLDNGSVLKFTREIANALAYAHSKGIVHRDIKPSNILIDEHSAARVVDFGLAQILGNEQNKKNNLTMTGEAIGTPQYISPEQRSDMSKSDARSDIYSLGVMVYEMLTGELPEGAWELPSELGCDPGWDLIVTNAIRKRPEQRFQSMTDFIASLDAVGTAASDPKNTAVPAIAQEDRYRTSVPLSSTVMKCPGCGVDNTGDNRFCSGCGASLYDRCPCCQTEIRAGLRFCGKCGVDIPEQRKTIELKSTVSKLLEDASSIRDDIAAATEILFDAAKIEESISSDTGSGGIRHPAVHAALNSLWTEEALAAEIFPSSGTRHLELLSRVFKELPDRKDIQAKIEELAYERDNLLNELKSFFSDGYFLSIIQTASESRWSEYAGIAAIVADVEPISKALENASAVQDDIAAATEILLDAVKIEQSIVNGLDMDNGSRRPLAVHTELNNLWTEEALAAEIFPSSGTRHLELLSRVFKELPDRKDIQAKIEELAYERDNLLNELKSFFKDGNFLSIIQTASKSRWSEYAGIAAIVAKARERFTKASNLIESSIPELIDAKRNCELNKVLAELESTGVHIDGLSELRKETDLTIHQAQQLYEHALKQNSARNPQEAAQALDKLLGLCSDYPDSLDLRRKIDIQASQCLKDIDGAKKHIARREYKKAINLLMPLVSTYNSDEVSALYAGAVKGAKSAFRKKMCIIAAIVLLSTVSIIITVVVAVNSSLNYTAYSSYCEKANSAFSGMEYEKAVGLFNEALKVPGYDNDASAKNFLRKAQLALERKSQFDTLIADGSQCLERKEWNSAEKAFKAALKISGYECNSKARKSLKECEDYFAEKNDMFNNAVCKGSKALAEKNYEKALESFDEAMKIPGYENHEVAAKQREQAKLNLDCKNRFDRLMIEGAKALSAENYKKSLEAFDEALKIPGYENDYEAARQRKQANTQLLNREATEIERKQTDDKRREEQRIADYCKSIENKISSLASIFVRYANPIDTAAAEIVFTEAINEPVKMAGHSDQELAEAAKLAGYARKLQDGFTKGKRMNDLLTNSGTELDDVQIELRRGLLGKIKNVKNGLMTIKLLSTNTTEDIKISDLHGFFLINFLRRLESKQKIVNGYFFYLLYNCDFNSELSASAPDEFWKNELPNLEILYLERKLRNAPETERDALKARLGNLERLKATQTTYTPTVVSKAVDAVPATQIAVADANWKSPDIGMEFVWIKALDCWVGKYEVTNGEYRKFKTNHDSGNYRNHSLNGNRQPVVFVSCDDAVEFAKWLTGQEQKSGRLPVGYSYRLPSDNEWTTFCQCGDNRIYPWGSSMPPKYGNYSGQETGGERIVILGYDDSSPVSCPVEQSGMNDWGLYGVGGNVWECTVKPGSNLFFDAYRGASWSSRSSELGSLYRDSNNTSLRGVKGFRLVLAKNGTANSELEAGTLKSNLYSGMITQEGTTMQTLCPNCQRKIEKKFYLDSNGKRVYFCSSICAYKVSKYIAGLATKLEADGIVLDVADKTRLRYRKTAL